jgi:dGTPase
MQRFPKLTGRRVIHETVRRMINRLVVDLVETSRHRIESAGPSSVDAVRRHPERLMGFSDEIRELGLELKRFLRTRLYRHYRVHRMSVKARRIVSELFSAFMDDAELLPPEHQDLARELAEQDGEAGRARVVADYIAGMTDRYAITEHGRIFNPITPS